MDYIKECGDLEKQIIIKSELARGLISNIKRDSKRFLTLLGKYNAQKNSDGIFSQKQISFKQIQQYCDLLSKQFSFRLQELNEKISKAKLDIQRLGPQIRARPNENYTQRIQKLKQRVKEIEGQLETIWRQEHFLALNYRLDISAKELQRWTTIINSNNVDQVGIRDAIDKIFK